MISADPLFADPADNDFHLLYSSPCKDTGNNSAPGVALTDFENDIRPAYGVVDMGADEFFTHLYTKGNSFPGGTVEIHFVGLPSTAPIGLFLSSGILNTPLASPYGQWHLDFPVFLFGPLGAIPSTGIHTFEGILPPTIDPTTFYMQAIIGNELTNLCTLEVEE